MGELEKRTLQALLEPVETTWMKEPIQCEKCDEPMKELKEAGTVGAYVSYCENSECSEFQKNK